MGDRASEDNPTCICVTVDSSPLLQSEPDPLRVSFKLSQEKGTERKRNSVREKKLHREGDGERKSGKQRGREVETPILELGPPYTKRDMDLLGPITQT